jgi:hypothetical protein
MRRLMVWIPFVAGLVTFVLAPVACRTRHKKAPVAQASTEDNQLSVIEIDDPRAAAQLTSGFHTLENNSWRWTTRHFAVTLRPPAGSAKNGARLELKFVLPEQVFKAVGPVTLVATVQGLSLAAETYSKDGEYTYARDVPAQSLGGNSVVVQFAIDKGLAPNPKDFRELALIVTRIALTPK